MDTSFLKRPVVWFDLESTGANPVSDRITEIACIKIHPDGTKETKKTYVNPLMPISKEASEITGITDETVKNAPTFNTIAQNIVDFFSGSDIGGYNINRFDIPMLLMELNRSKIDFETIMSEQNIKFWDPFQIMCKKHPRDLSSAYTFYTGKTIENAHSAEADIMATIEVAFAQMERYDDIGKTVDEIAVYCKNEKWADMFGKLVWKDNEAAISFGKHNGKTLRTLVEEDRGYLTWAITKASFPKDTVEIIENATMGRFLHKEKGYIN